MEKIKDQLRSSTNWLQDAQNPDGGWPRWCGEKSSINATAQAAIALRMVGTNSSELIGAINFLDSCYSDSFEPQHPQAINLIHDAATILTYASCCPNKETPALGKAVNRLLRSQNSDGGWPYAWNGKSSLWPTLICVAALKSLGDMAAARKALKLSVNWTITTGYQANFHPVQFAYFYLLTILQELNLDGPDFVEPKNGEWPDFLEGREETEGRYTWRHWGAPWCAIAASILGLNPKKTIENLINLRKNNMWWTLPPNNDDPCIWATALAIGAIAISKGGRSVIEVAFPKITKIDFSILVRNRPTLITISEQQKNDAHAFLLQQIGKPYKWGEEGPDAYDCSGLLMACFSRFGINLPHSASLISDLCVPAKLPYRVFDLLFFGNPIVHTGILVEESKMIDASSAKGCVFCGVPKEPYIVGRLLEFI